MLNMWQYESTGTYTKEIRKDLTHSQTVCTRPFFFPIPFEQPGDEARYSLMRSPSYAPHKRGSGESCTSSVSQWNAWQVQ